MDSRNEINKNKIKEVAAIRYKPEEDDVPVIVALGRGAAAEKIVEKAREHDIPVMEDKGLAELLNKFSVGDQIPPEVYTVVAQILVFIGQMDQGFGERVLSESDRRRLFDK